MDDLGVGIDEEFGETLLWVDEEVADKSSDSLAREKRIVAKAGDVRVELLVGERGKLFLFDGVVGKTERGGSSGSLKADLRSDVLWTGDELGMMRAKSDVDLDVVASGCLREEKAASARAGGRGSDRHGGTGEQKAGAGVWRDNLFAVDLEAVTEVMAVRDEREVAAGDADGRRWGLG